MYKLVYIHTYVKSDNTCAIVTLWNGSAGNQHGDFHLFCANLLDLPALFTGSVKICWSCVLTCFPLGSSCSENASSWPIRKGEENGTGPYSAPVMRLIQLVLLLPWFPCPSLSNRCIATGHMSQPQPQPQQGHGAGFYSSAGYGALARPESGGGDSERELKSEGKGKLMLCCRMSIRRKPGLVDCVTCRESS